MSSFNYNMQIQCVVAIVSLEDKPLTTLWIRSIPSVVYLTDPITISLESIARITIVHGPGHEPPISWTYGDIAVPYADVRTHDFYYKKQCSVCVLNVRHGRWLHNNNPSITTGGKAMHQSLNESTVNQFKFTVPVPTFKLICGDTV